MKLNTPTVLVAFIAMLLMTMGMTMAYDISSYNDSGVRGSFISTFSLTAGGETDEAFFLLQLAQSLKISGAISFQAQLPRGFDFIDVTETNPPPTNNNPVLSNAVCRFIIRNSAGVERIIPGEPIVPLWASTGNRLLQCRMRPTTSDATVTILPSDRIQMIYSGIRRVSGSHFLPECSASVYKINSVIDLIFAPFGWVKDLFHLDARACCSDAFIQLFNDNVVLDRAFPDNCLLGSYDPEETCGDNCPSPSTHLTSLSFSAGLHITAARTQLNVGFRTAIDLAALSPRPTGTVTANDEDVPGYIWVRAPRYRASLANVVGVSGTVGLLDAVELGITCGITHTTVSGSILTHLATQFTASPAVLVRPINANDQSQGVLVQCALGLNIPAGSTVNVVVGGLFAPPTEDSCGRYGLDSHSAHCCSGYGVEYRFGNALGSNIIALSLAAQICPNFFYDEESVVIARSRVVNQLEFEPISSTIQPDQIIQVPRFSFYVSELPSGFSAANPTFHFFFQGLDLPNFDTLVVAANGYVTVPGPITITTATNTFTTTDIQAKHTLNGGLEIALLSLDLNPLQYVTVFFPPLITTDSLPNTNTCRSAINGIPTLDETCCNGYRLEVRLGGVSTFTYSSQCPVAIVPANNNGIVRYTKEVCNVASTFNLNGCCVRNYAFIESLLPAVAAQCFEYICADPTSPIFSDEVCCNHGLYRHNARCCSGGFFCPNHCCGNFVPGFVDVFGTTIPPMVGFFNEQRCCEPAPAGPTVNTPPIQDSDYLFGFPGLFQICSCYEDMNEEEWVDFAEGNCCASETVYVPPGGIAALPPICSCQRLFDDLAPVVTDPPTVPPVSRPVAEQNSIIRAWLLQYPSMTPQSCCAWRTLADETDDFEAFDNAVFIDQFCDCAELQGTIPIPGANAECCQYEYIPGIAARCIAPLVPIVCPAPCGCAMGDCSASCAAQGPGCHTRRVQRVDISDLESGGDTHITIAAPVREPRPAAAPADEVQEDAADL